MKSLKEEYYTYQLIEEVINQIDCDSYDNPKILKQKVEELNKIMKEKGLL